jgi:hypothetical protein
MASQICLDRIKTQKPPNNRECPYACADENFVNGTHCKEMGLDPNVPFLVKDSKAKIWCYCCCSCLSRDTPLEQKPGEYVLVQDVNAGDTLLVAGEDLKWKPGVVKLRTGDAQPMTYQGMYYVLYKFEDEAEPRNLFVTPDHLFMRADDRKLKAVQHLIPGDKLMRNDGRSAEVIFVAVGAYHTEIHTIEMEGKFDGKNLEGHLINANGLVTTDYLVQAHFSLEKVRQRLLFTPKGGAEALEVGEKDYSEQFPSAARDAFINNQEAWPPGFMPLRRDLFNIPVDAKGFVVDFEARQILRNGKFVPDSDLTPQYSIYKIFGYMRAVYPKTIYVLDWYNELPNAYSFMQAGQRFIVMTGGLARFEGLYTEGIALILASVQARLEGAKCVGDADYEASAYGLRRVWPDDMIPTLATSGINQVAEVFKSIKKQQRPTPVCDAPTIKCRLETFESGLGFGGVPDCAKPSVMHFGLMQATAKNGPKGVKEVVAVFNMPCEVVTATTSDNYSFVPPVEITDAKMEKKSADGSKVVLTVKGFDPKVTYTLTAENVLSAMGLPLSPKHKTVTVELGK